MIPVVMDLFQLQKSLHHHYRSLGGWTFAFEPYYEAPVNLTELLDSEGITRLAAVSDPYVYIDRFANIPKLVIDACGDEFFLIDDDMFFFDSLPGQKFRLMLPNAEHSLATAEQQAIDGATAFSLAVVHNLPMPKPSWQFSGGRPEGAPSAPSGFPLYGVGSASGNITFRCDSSGGQQPTNVTAWFAYSAEGTGRRDFRLAAGYPKTEPQLVIWLPYDLTNDPTGDCEWMAPEPERAQSQWSGLIMDLRFPLQSGCSSTKEALGKDSGECLSPAARTALQWALESGLEFDLTTAASVSPATYAFPDCSGHGCQGKLV